MTTKLTYSTLTLDDLTRFVDLQEKNLSDSYEWTKVDTVPLSDEEKHSLQSLTAHLLLLPTHLMNEATIWARAIYPLLMLAEQEPIRAWAGVPLKAHYPQFELDGIADGVLGKVVAGRVKTPYLVVVETKKGVENQNPLGQLYAQLLAAAHLNWEQDQLAIQELFGCYTIADIWTFVRVEAEGFETDRPTLRVEFSREYMEKTEAERIFQLLKRIVSNHLNK